MVCEMTAKKGKSSSRNPKTMRKTGYGIFIDRALEWGASDAKIINAGSIVTAPWVRLKCQYGCGGYNSSLCCPPHSPAHDETRKVIDCYKKAILVHAKALGKISKIIIKLEREIFLAGYYKALGFGSGPCTLCKSCCTDGSCVHPEKVRPSMESCGIDVYATVRHNGFSIEVVRDHRSDQNYYGVVLIE
jgi:predicted metal-binding protein